VVAKLAAFLPFERPDEDLREVEELRDLPPRFVDEKERREIELL